MATTNWDGGMGVASTLSDEHNVTKEIEHTTLLFVTTEVTCEGECDTKEGCPAL